MASLRLLTLNIWNQLGPFEQRLARVREGLARLAPEVVGLQEVVEVEGRSQAHALAEGLGYEVAFGAARDYGGGVRFGNALLSRFPIVEQEVCALPVLDTDEHRAVLCTKLQHPAGLLPVFVTHLSWRLDHGYVREAQVVRLTELIAARRTSRCLPSVLVGDFNAVPDSTEIRYLTGLTTLGGRSAYFFDAHAVAGAGQGITFDPDRNPYAALSPEPPRRLDYVFVRGGDERGRGRPRRAEVVLDDVEGGVAASDHYGVLAELEL